MEEQSIHPLEAVQLFRKYCEWIMKSSSESSVLKHIMLKACCVLASGLNFSVDSTEMG